MSSGSVCITSTKPSVQTPVTPKKKKKSTLAFMKTWLEMIGH
jgi:hypothetical protein